MRIRWIFLALALAGCQPREKPLVVGMDLSYPPFEMIDESNKPAGVSVEIARALANHLHKPLQIENLPFVGLIPSLQSGHLDCVISSMTDTQERRQSISFSDPYLSIGLAMLVGRNAGLQGLPDLDQPGRTVVVRQGTTGEVWARKALKAARLLVVEKENAAVLEVVQGKADAFVYDQMSIWKNWRQNTENTRALLAPIQKESWAIGVRKDNEQLLAEINAFLRQFRESGGFEKLGDRYLREQKEAFAKENIPFFF